MKYFRFTPTLALLAGVFLFANLAHSQSKTLVLTNARVEIGDGQVLEKGMIVLENGKIVSVGAVSTLPIGVDVLDLAGKVIYPGFIDGFARGALKIPDQATLPTSPPASENPPIEFWSGNRRGIRADIDASKILDAEALGSGWFEQGVAAANLSGPNIAFGGMTALYLTGGKPESALLKPGISQTISFGGGGGPGGGGGGGGGGYPSSIMGRVALIRQILLDADFAAKNPPSEKPDPVLVSLADAIQGRMPVTISATTERDISRSMMLMDEFHFPIILLGGREAWQHADEIKKRSVGVILDASPGVAPSTAERDSGPPMPVLEERLATWKENARYAIKLNAAGVPFSWSSGSSRSDFLKDIRSHIEFGLPRDAALAALTTNPAKLFGVSDKLGTVSAGKIANLTIMDGDFASKDAKVLFVFVQGEKFEVKK